MKVIHFFFRFGELSFTKSINNFLHNIIIREKPNKFIYFSPNIEVKSWIIPLVNLKEFLRDFQLKNIFIGDQKLSNLF